MSLHFRLRPTPSFAAMDALLCEQLGPLLDQARSDGPGGESLIELFDVLDDDGRHVYDLHLFCGDDGRLHHVGTMDYVASFSQGYPTGTDDAQMLAALRDAHVRWARDRRAAKG